MGFFSMDGPIYKIGGIIADILILGILWVLLAVPIVTIGASTSAVYYVFTKRINGRDGYLWREFWSSFRQNFRTATAVWLTLLVIYIVLTFNIVNIGLLEGMADFILIVQFVILVQITFITMYAFPLISRFEMGYKEVFKTAFFLANRHILITLSNIVLLISAAIIAFLQPAFIFVMVGAYCYFSSFLIIKAFRKYRPDLDLETNVGHMAPLRLEEKKKEAQEESQKEEESYEEPIYDNNSTVLNLERLKDMQTDKEQ